MNELPFSDWRLLITPAATGAWNMAVDEAILRAMGQGSVPPTLRLYAWEPACLSIGYAQPISEVDCARLDSYGWHLVRRPTGGRAILHTDELTYAIIGPSHEPRLSGGVLESYQILSQGLLKALHLLSVPAQASPHSYSLSNDGAKGPVCFEVPSNYEITLNGKKLIGSAQARRRDGVLQHGSLPIHGDLSRITWVLSFQDAQIRLEAASRLLERATTLESLLGYRLEWDIVAQAFVAAFQEVLHINLIQSELSPHEIEMAERLVIEKYANREWTHKV